MLVAYLIMLREGIEAALIVGIVAGYLKQTGRDRWMSSVWLGVGLAVALCVAVGVALDLTSGEFPQRQQELFEGAVALIAVFVLTSMVFWMKKAARSIKAELQQSVDAALRPGDRQGWAFVCMAFLAVGREGLESVFFLLATFQQSTGPGVPVGAVLGLATAMAVGVGITYGGMKLDLRRFFRWTGVFIIFVAAGLLASAVRSLHEAGLWNGLQERAFDLSNVLPADGIVGTLLSGLLGYQDSPAVGELLAYVLFLVPALLLFFTQGSPVRTPRPA